MSQSPSANGISPRRASFIVIAMLGMIALPATITLNTVQRPATLVVPHDPTPYGYTWSLLLFIIPVAVIAFWFVPHDQIPVPRRAFWRTIGILAPLGFGLDFFLAHRLFVFPNHLATLQINAPALGAPVPVEEYVFYLTGFIAVLLIYLWLDEFWLSLYNVPDYAAESKNVTYGTVIVFEVVKLWLASGKSMTAAFLGIAPERD